jgi:hypothetical protein
MAEIFNAQMDELWEKYLAHCKETGIKPATRDIFAQVVYEQGAKLMSHAMADKMPKKDVGQALYVAVRVKDLPNPLSTSTIKQCGQCGEDVWIDPSMLDVLSKSKAIICNACLPEITGKTREEIIKNELEKLDESN